MVEDVMRWQQDGGDAWLEPGDESYFYFNDVGIPEVSLTKNDHYRDRRWCKVKNITIYSDDHVELQLELTENDPEDVHDHDFDNWYKLDNPPPLTNENELKPADDQEILLDEEELDEKAPEGWEGTVKSMKKHKGIKNPWALAHYMKNKGYHHHK